MNKLVASVFDLLGVLSGWLWQEIAGWRLVRFSRRHQATPGGICGTCGTPSPCPPLEMAIRAFVVEFGGLDGGRT